jgi:hypothetical protein
MLCHRGPVKDMVVDREGYYMVTSGQDCQVKVWDVRMFKPVHQYFTATPATSLSLSQKGMLSVGYGPHVQVSVNSGYMHVDAIVPVIVNSSRMLVAVIVPVSDCSGHLHVHDIFPVSLECRCQWLIPVNGIASATNLSLIELMCVGRSGKTR